MVRITAEDLDDYMFVDADGNMLDSTLTVYVLMPDPKLRRTDDLCRLWNVPMDDIG